MSAALEERERQRMVDEQIVARGVRDEAVIAAFRRVAREAFLPERLREFAYEDRALPIGEGQTVSQPFIVARMVEALRLRPDDRVLEIGAGSGYAAAILAEIAAEVYTIERHKKLAEDARKRLRAAGYGRVHVIHGDGSLGYPAQAPYDGIAVAASGPEVPRSLKEQLVGGGRLVIPVGVAPGFQHLLCVTRESEVRCRREALGAVRFVPLVGAEGWDGTSA
jgi:protein-L-isoaspartate(D-aspartate) O-methyltransferase